MKKIIPLLLLTLLYSCEDSSYREYRGNAPVYMTYEEFRQPITTESVRDLENPGKIYFKDNFIFIIEEFRGIHIYDNANPSSPQKISFVKVPGIADMVISGNILYADSFMDLVVLDVQNPDNIQEKGRLKDIFPYVTPPLADSKLPAGYVDREKGVVASWEVKTIKERVYDQPVIYPVAGVRLDGSFYSALANYSSNASSGVSSGGVGIGGSMARFGLKDNILYLLDNSTLHLLDITTKTNPSEMFNMSAGWGIETMFITGKNMFMGTTTGMRIFDISNPVSPVLKSTYNHVRSCDPVIVDDTLAFVTLRSGTGCGGNVNSLDVVNIKNVSAPSLVTSYSMTNPHGLGKDGNLLFICDGSAGLKIYDASNPRTVSANLKYAYPAINANDVIPVGDLLIMIADEGLYQYDYSDPGSIKLLSTILVTKTR
ncbi:MAG TPA: hypothetical protein VK155_03250 [Bacteroidales bacterium]|nr:hypothetical protein [Bacteroidales bacterium]